MQIVTAKRYEVLKQEFFERHEYDYRVDTSSMDEYGRYYKTYIFDDDAIWYETMMPEYVKQEVEIKLCKTTIEVKMFKTEFWSSENAESKVFYERF